MSNVFWRVECGECGNQQTVFSRAASTVECQVCGESIARTTGGRPELDGRVVETLATE